MNCPKCKLGNYVKDGKVNGRQRYWCKECQYHYTVEYRGKPESMKREALILYLEGLGFRSIGRFLRVSHVAVYNWIKGIGEKIEQFRGTSDIEVIEMDEMHTYLRSKKTFAGYGLLLIEMGRNISTVKLAIGRRKRDQNFGTG